MYIYITYFDAVCAAYVSYRSDASLYEQSWVRPYTRSFGSGCAEDQITPWTWPLQDILSLQGFCAPVNHPNIAPSTCIAHTITY